MDQLQLFAEAARKKFRFATQQGQLTTEQLWDLPLLSRTGVDLNTVAQTVYNDLQGVSEKSFVARTDPMKATHEAKLEVVKHIIAYKQDEAARRAESVEKAAKRELLIEALAKKQQSNVEGMSEEEIRKQIAALD